MENKTYETFKKIRKNWNGLNPSTRIVPNKKNILEKKNTKENLKMSKKFCIIYTES